MLTRRACARTPSLRSFLLLENSLQPTRSLLCGLASQPLLGACSMFPRGVFSILLYLMATHGTSQPNWPGRVRSCPGLPGSLYVGPSLYHPHRHQAATFDAASSFYFFECHLFEEACKKDVRV